MKKLLFSLIAISSLLVIHAAELEWTTDLPAAKAKAKAEGKMVMMDFTGSDWCGWCIKLHKEVFSTPEFAEYAKNNLVLVEVDFPQKKQQSEALKKANEALQSKYSVEGYPTIIVLNSNGKKTKTLNYMPGGPKVFIAALEKSKK